MKNILTLNFLSMYAVLAGGCVAAFQAATRNFNLPGILISIVTFLVVSILGAWIGGSLLQGSYKKYFVGTFWGLMILNLIFTIMGL